MKKIKAYSVCGIWETYLVTQCDHGKEGESKQIEITQPGCQTYVRVGAEDLLKAIVALLSD